MMNQSGLFSTNLLNQRGRGTDRLIIERLLRDPSDDRDKWDSDEQNAYSIICKWAELETSGKLEQRSETQLETDFLTEIMGEALHYTRFSEGVEEWNLNPKPSVGGLTPDAALGQFKSGSPQVPLVLVELKGPTVHLDRDRFNGRTPVQQLWDYFAHAPDCRWGILTNMVSFRLYERNQTPQRYEHFALQDLRTHEHKFARFYRLFAKAGLLGTPKVGQPPRAAALLENSNNRQREVGDKLYNYYSENRQELIRYLHREREYDVDHAIEMAQRLLDRIIFIAFCEDRELLNDRLLERAHKGVPPFTKVTNPRWQNYLALFRSVDKGHADIGVDSGYNGGLFEESDVDELDLPDNPWANFFKGIGDYDFRDEVNLDVLGHLFEKSITELEKLREGDLFSPELEDGKTYATMPQSAKRKRMGIYYTPPEFTAYIVEITVDQLIAERFIEAVVQHGITRAQAEENSFPDTIEYWRDCLDILCNLKVCDPACGSGAFLFQAYNRLEQRYDEVLKSLERLGDTETAALQPSVPEMILKDNLYGVDLSPEAVEITQLALWIRTATRDRKLTDLTHNIVNYNSLVQDPEVHPRAIDWYDVFPEVFDREESGFDCIIGNPPWERMNLEEREFFSLSAPEIATATDGAKRRRLVESLKKKNPELYERYLKAKEEADSLRLYCRNSGKFPLTGRGRTNTYAAFAELASEIVAPYGRAGLLVPSGIASDNTTKDFFASIADAKRLNCLFDFENRKGLFADVHRSFKFSIFSINGRAAESDKADFVFFAHELDEIHTRRRHIELTPDDIRLMNPNTRTCPIFRTRRDTEITRSIYRRVPVLIDKNRKTTGNPWSLRFRQGLFNQTSDAKLFVNAAKLKSKRYRLEGNIWKKGKKSYLPLYEAKMVQMYDHRAASVIVEEKNWVRQGQTDSTTPVHHQNPEFAVQPRFWVEYQAVEESLGSEIPEWFLCFKDVTSPTNQRTMIASFIPPVAVVNSAPLVFVDANHRLQCCFLANLNCFAYDFIARQKISNVHLNFFIVEQLPTFPPDRYAERCPWRKRETLEHWISERVLKLTCTAEDMLPLADAAEFTSGSYKKEYGGRLHKWNAQNRAELMAELDAAFFILYEIEREDAEYILSTFSGTNDPATGLPGATTSTADLILDTYDDLRARSMG